MIWLKSLQITALCMVFLSSLARLYSFSKFRCKLSKNILLQFCSGRRPGLIQNQKKKSTWSVCMFVYLFVCLFVGLFVCLFIATFFLSVIDLFTGLSVFKSIVDMFTRLTDPVKLTHINMKYIVNGRLSGEQSRCGNSTTNLLNIYPLTLKTS